MCARLHHFLRIEFAPAYQEHARHTQAVEEENGTSSPDPPAPAGLPPGPGAWEECHFACDSPACGRLLLQPMVLNCGHVVCRACCPPGQPQGQQACPACGSPQPVQPAVCTALHNLLQQLFPAGQVRRAADVAAAAAATAAAVAAAQTEPPGPPAAGGAEAGGREAAGGSPSTVCEPGQLAGQAAGGQLGHTGDGSSSAPQGAAASTDPPPSRDAPQARGDQAGEQAREEADERGGAGGGGGEEREVSLLQATQIGRAHV